MPTYLNLRSGNSGVPFLGTNEGDTLLWSVAEGKWYVGAGGGGGDVASVFGRTGVVVAATGDYDGDQVDNVSTVPGASLSDALEYLLANAGAVASVFGRTGVVVAVTGDYDSDQVDNASSLPGASVSDAIESINSQLGGTALTNADQTLATTGRYVQAAGSITAIRTKTLTPNALPKYFTLEIGTQAFNEVITNGGPNGGSYTVLAGAREVVTALSDGTDVVFSAAPLGVEPVP